MSIKRDLWLNYGLKEDFIGFSVKFRTNSEGKVAADKEPTEVYFNKKKFQNDKLENIREKSDSDVKLVFIVVKDIVDEQSLASSKEYDITPQYSDKSLRERIASDNMPEVRYNLDDPRAVEFVKGLPNAKPYDGKDEW